MSTTETVEDAVCRENMVKRYVELTIAFHTYPECKRRIKLDFPTYYQKIMHYVSTRSKYCPMVYYSVEQLLKAIKKTCNEAEVLIFIDFINSVKAKKGEIPTSVS